MNVPRIFARVYLRRKVTKDVQSEPPLVIISKDSAQAESLKVHTEGFPKVQKSIKDVSKKATPKVVQEPVIPKSTPRKKSIPKRVLRKPMDVIISSREKYKRLYEFENVKDLTDRDLERMVYLFEHVEDNKVLRERLEELEKFKKRRMDVGSSNYDTQRTLFEARLKELDATNLKPNVNVEEVSKDIYSSYAVASPIKVFEESKYNVERVAARKIVRSRAATAILPQDNEEYTKNKNSESLQQFTRAYVDEMVELVVERGVITCF
ncbi:hypothetical protein L1987_74416 [Smallanthus sonchifolius]|uniref:Uncharacterized protein n=1 Tax=Smallanthus sonchifolius TaxID=185202 RepID=A0ACB9A3U9_9ASTR|nr:hypothetical protein L1987_74416 [Smallanthus sonchifolius]